MDKDNQSKDQQQQQSSQQQQPSTATGNTKMDELQDEFLNTGRIGRRNAMPDILDENRETSTADLPLKLSALTTSGEYTYNKLLSYLMITLITFNSINSLLADSSSSSSSTCPNQTNNK